MMEAPARLAAIGDNNPPEKTPFEIVSERIDDLWTEAQNWLDGSKVETESDAEAVSKLLDLFRKAAAEADDARKAEVKPYDEAKAAIQAKYAPLIADTKAVKGRTVIAIEACKKALAPWLEKKEREQREAAEAARKAAEEKQRIAQEALAKAREADDLAQREAAEQKLQEAKRAEQIASKAEKAKPNVASGGRAIGLRRSYAPELVDGVAAARHYWATRRADMEAFLLDQARKDVAAGVRDIPGFTINEIKGVA